MGRINGRAKGAAAEREAAQWLKDTFHLEVTPERNLEQVRSGGHDLLHFQPFAFEIKRCETLALRQWWVQAVTSCTDEYNEPVVMYRQNRKQWQFLISAKHIGLKTGYIQLAAPEFVRWVKAYITRLTEAD